jgi:spoIIIJ-associated protein
MHAAHASIEEPIPAPFESEPPPMSFAEHPPAHRMEPAPRPSARAPEETRAPDLSGDELAVTSRKVTEEMLRAMGFEPRVEVRAEGNRVDVTVEVERDGELLNGRQGETRQALQHLLNRFINRGDGSRYHLQLEVNDYWHRRESELEKLARSFAEDAVTRNAEVVTDYLNAQERRIVHVTLREDSRVRTFSLGSGMVKRVAIAPASFPERTEEESES